MHEFDEKSKRGPGDNGGPPLVPLTAKTKVECVRQLLGRMDLSSAQKCIGAMMIVQADTDWSAEIKTAELQQAASAKDRETVFRATKVLDDKGIISKASGRGQSGKYVVIPPRVVDAVIEAYAESKSGRVNADQLDKKRSGETRRHKQSVPTTHPVGFEPTSPVKPVGFEQTTSRQPRAEEVIKLNNNINNLTKSNTIPSEQETARDDIDFNALAEKLTSACNGALDDPVNCQGLASLAIPLMWMREGCDLEADIIPTLHGYGKSAHGKRIRSWDYFTGGVTRAKEARLRGLPAPVAGQAKESKSDKYKRIFQAVSDEKGKR